MNDEDQFEIMDTQPDKKKSFNILDKVKGLKDKGQSFTSSMYDRMDQHDRLVAERKEQKRIEREQKILEMKVLFKKGLIITVVLLIAIVVGFGAFKYFDYKRGIPVGYKNEELIGKTYKEVEKDLKASGFQNINKIELDDLDLASKDLENTVQVIRIGNAESFTSTTYFPYDSSVDIIIHTIKNVPIPVSWKEARGQNVKDVEKTFKDSGFATIKKEPIYDLITGWLTKDGQVDQVVIGEKDRFNKGDKIRPDEVVTITYHTWKEK